MSETKIFTKIVVGVDDSADAKLAFNYAVKRAKLENSELFIVSILEDNEMNVYEALSKDYIHGQRADLEKHLQEYVFLAKQAGVKSIHTIIDEGNPGKMIVHRILPKINPSVLIIGSLAKRGPQNFGAVRLPKWPNTLLHQF